MINIMGKKLLYITANGEEFSVSDSTQITWNSNSNMNDFKTPGVYDIYGERTVKTDNLPIMNDGSGHSIAARLTVVASTLQPNNTEICITQLLQLSNRIGGEGNIYIRTYNENNNGLNGWSTWKKQQGMVESYINTDTVGITVTGGQTTGLNGMTENGIYSGIYTDDYTLQAPTFVETFVLIVINDYAVSSQAGTPRRISQLKYATDTLTGQCTVKKRIGTGDDSISWSDWEEIGGGSSEVDVTDAVKTYGLPALVSQGLVNNNTLYTAIIGGSGNLPTLDVNNKIKTFLLSKHNGSALAFKFYLEKIKIFENFIYDIKCYATDSNVNYHFYHFVVNNDLSKVSVTENTTILE